MTPARERWPGMTERRFDQLARWIGATCDEIGLADWIIDLCKVPAGSGDDDCAARIDPVYGQRHALITLAHDFATRYNPERQRYYLTHELLHLHLDRIGSTFRPDMALAHQLGETATALIRCEVHTNIEYAVDALAEVVAGGLPLP